MCWTRYYDGTTNCIGKLPNRDVKQAAIMLFKQIKKNHAAGHPVLIVNGEEKNIMREIELPLCEGTEVKHTWVQNGIYAYDIHVGGLKQYYACHCEDCGAKWVESPMNATELIAELGPDVDWRLYTE